MNSNIPGSPSPILVQRLDASRWCEYRALRLEALQEASIAFGSSYQESLQLPQAEWQERIKTVLFAVSADTPIGMISVVFNRRVKTRHIAEIFAFYVAREYRGAGTGRMLLEAALTEIRSEKEVIKVRLSVNPEQKKALRLYRKYGFKPVGLLKKELLIEGCFYDEILMEKFVNRRSE
jgi:ribosomal protein S18 acetylase RimI-like enzyme